MPITLLCVTLVSAMTLTGGTLPATLLGNSGSLVQLQKHRFRPNTSKRTRIEEYLSEEWKGSGIVPKVLDDIPPFVINVDYGYHECVHLGNEIRQSYTIQRPVIFEFPGNKESLYTAVLLDLDAPNIFINWMVVDIPGNQQRKGKLLTSGRSASSLKLLEDYLDVESLYAGNYFISHWDGKTRRECLPWRLH